MVIDLALEKGMRKSSRDLQLLEKVNSEEETFEKLDLNKDGFIDKEEVFKCRFLAVYISICSRRPVV